MRRPVLFGAGAAAAAWSLPALAPISPPVAAMLGLPRRIDEPDAVAITFDDGPHSAGTPAVLDVLSRMDARATFFLVGEQVERDPGLAREIADAGHAIAVHGYTHRCLLAHSPGRFRVELDQAISVIADATGVEPRTYRPPYGIFSPPAMRIVAAARLRSLLWSRWGHDWRSAASPPGIAAELIRDLGPGDVLLLHDADHYATPDSWRATAAALPTVLAAVEEAELRTVTV